MFLYYQTPILITIKIKKVNNLLTIKCIIFLDSHINVHIRRLISLFILSIKPLKNKIFVIFIILIILSLGLFLINSNKQKKVAVSEIGEYTLSAKTNDERVKFLSQFGWQVSPNPIEICDITIPSKFNSVYENYNDIQKSQGLDLNQYKEQNCTRYTYQILNYKNAPGSIRANLLVLNNHIIGGDICSLELNGFMHGFVAPENYKTAYNSYATKVVSTTPKDLSEEPLKTTYRESLEPEPSNPFAPTD